MASPQYAGGPAESNDPSIETTPRMSPRAVSLARAADLTQQRPAAAAPSAQREGPGRPIELADRPDATAPRAHGSRPAIQSTAEPGLSSSTRPAAQSAAQPPARSATHQVAQPAAAPSTEDRSSFLRPDSDRSPATQGWRGLLTRMGLPQAPGPREAAERADIAAVAAHWRGPRTVSVVNSKGGSSKSTTAALLSAVFARYGGTGVLTWENNQTRGTLGWRTEQGFHDATLMDLLPAVPSLLERQAQVGDLASFVHHQTQDRYAVLRAQPMLLADEQRISPEDVSAIHEVASKYNRLIVMDSGNDESDPMWRRMVDHTAQLVVVTTTRDDHAEVASLLLHTLAQRDPHRAQLASNAVVIVSQADRNATKADLQRVAGGFAKQARTVVTIPFDPAMVEGQLRLDALRPATRRAWLSAGAAVARGL